MYNLQNSKIDTQTQTHIQNTEKNTQKIHSKTYTKHTHTHKFTLAKVLKEWRYFKMIAIFLSLCKNIQSIEAVERLYLIVI